ncbi:hypothetical protein L1987_29741 [Smallanthus sonchifolius]|uniref:Uncharacterized protein n=1 Tax=Smallanthus sonchifolius TaxID=185202 RepID=A0ACB9I1G0_9ASTR|nr:hypothetical protein L1987_29741 [Smallanthus sonchifolius]
MYALNLEEYDIAKQLRNKLNEETDNFVGFNQSIIRYTPISDPDSKGYFDLMINVCHAKYSTALLKEKDEIITQVMAQGRQLYHWCETKIEIRVQKYYICLSI